MAKQDERFIKVYEQGMINCMEIWVDRETGVNYLFHFNGNAAGLTPQRMRKIYRRPLLPGIWVSGAGCRQDRSRGSA